MTNKEAIRYLTRMRDRKIYSDIFDAKTFTEQVKKHTELYTMAIEALETEPCEDCISRAKVNDIIVNVLEHTDCKDEYIDRVLLNIDQLPSVQPERPKGEWLVTDAYPHNVYCSVCHERYAQTHWAVWKDEEFPLPRNYCPNCGADMRGEE